MIFVKAFKGYEDRTLQLDTEANIWIHQNGARMADIKVAMNHENEAPIE